MLNELEEASPWIQTIEALRVVSSEHGIRPKMPSLKVKSVVDSTFPQSKSCMIRITDRASPSTVTVEWGDPTVAHYGAQLWRLGSARASGSCAISGATITRGAAVYRPSIGRFPPQNRNAMILASTIDQMLAVESTYSCATPKEKAEPF
jgi:Domain of unknown function (DUF3331)